MKKLVKRSAFGLLIAMIIVLAVATVIEKFYGSDATRDMIYTSLPFVTMWALIAVTSATYVIMSKLHKRLPVFALHMSLLLIIVGAGITFFTASRGKVILPNDTVVDSYTDTDSVKHKLPFSLSLDEFTIITYPGTQAPMDFVSKITLTDGAEKVTGQVSMNKIFSHNGYRLYQMGYDANRGGTVLQVAHDPWGIAVTYCGYIMLFISSIWILADKREKFRALVRNYNRMAVVGLMCISSATCAYSQRTISPAIANELSQLYILHNDRICPFKTFARDVTMKIYGKYNYNGFSAEQVVAGWMFFYDDWASQPMIKIKSAKVRQALGITGRYAALNDFYNDVNEYRLRQLVEQVLAGDDSDDRRGIQEANEKYEIVRMLSTGSMTKILPLNYHGELQWHSQSSSLKIPRDIDEDKWTFLRDGLNYFNELIIKNDQTGSIKFLQALRRYQEKECGEALPSPTQFKAEIIYDKISVANSPLSMALATLGIVLLVASCVRLARGKSIPRKVTIGTTIVLALALCFLTAMIILRWVVGRHVPLSNGFETMQFMAWATLVLTLALQRRHTGILAPGTLVGGLTMMVSTFGESNPQITQLMPVLQSPLLSIHVVVIMLSYSLLAFIAINGVMAIALRRHDEQVNRLHTVSLIMLYPAVFLLAAGVFIGAIWANISWGNYWSWDPKEVWALITLIIYALPLHSASLSKLARPLVFHIYCALAFLSVIITYFGVNFILGGMHSYA